MSGNHKRLNNASLHLLKTSQHLYIKWFLSLERFLSIDRTLLKKNRVWRDIILKIGTRDIIQNIWTIPPDPNHLATLRLTAKCCIFTAFGTKIKIFDKIDMLKFKINRCFQVLHYKINACIPLWSLLNKSAVCTF